MSGAAQAWLLPASAAARVAIGRHELVHLLPRETRLFPVPGAPAHCRHVLVWAGRPVPLVDLGQVAAGAGAGPAHDGPLAVVAWQPEAGGETAIGALGLAGLPRRHEVRADDAAPPDALPSRLLGFACSAFRVAGDTVAVLDLRRVFGAPPRDQPAPVEAPPASRSYSAQ